MPNIALHPALRLNQVGPLESTAPVAPESNGPSFKDTLGGLIKEVNTLQQDAGDAIHGVATGEVQSLHEAVIAMQKADVGFKFLMEMRNKLVEAYQEVMRMQV